MLTAFLLVEATAGMNVAVHEQLKTFKEVKSADRVHGLADIIAKIETDDLEALGAFVENRLSLMLGVEKTTTCIVLPG